MKIGGQWFTKDGWKFHGDNKTLLRSIIQGGKLGKFVLLNSLHVNDKWLIDEGEGVPENYELVVFIADQYLKVMKKFKPPLTYTTGMTLLTRYLVGLFKEDSCYTERFGGGIQWIIDNCQLFEGKTVEERTEAFKQMYHWYRTEDWRIREYEIYDEVFGVLFEKYGHDRFITLSVNYLIEMIIANKHNWKRHRAFDPKNWWPRGWGGVNAVLMGREYA